MIGSLQPGLQISRFVMNPALFSAKCAFSNIKFPDELQKKDQETFWINVGVKARLFLHLFASSMFVSLSGWFRLSSATNPEGLAQRWADLQRIGADIGRLLDGQMRSGL